MGLALWAFPPLPQGQPFAQGQPLPAAPPHQATCLLPSPDWVLDVLSGSQGLGVPAHNQRQCPPRARATLVLGLPETGRWPVSTAGNWISLPFKGKNVLNVSEVTSRWRPTDVARESHVKLEVTPCGCILSDHWDGEGGWQGEQALSHMPPPGGEEPKLGGSWAAWSPGCGALAMGSSPPSPGFRGCRGSTSWVS